MKKKTKTKAKSKVSTPAVGFNPGGDRVLIKPILPEKDDFLGHYHPRNS